MDCGYSLEPPRRRGSNEYPQSMFWPEVWEISEFFSENFHFLGIKIFRYLNRLVFIMLSQVLAADKHTWNIHYGNTLIQIYRKFHLQKLKNFQMKNSDIFHISAQNIDCGYSLEPPRWGGSNEYPQSMVLSRNKKNNVYPCIPQFFYIKVGYKGVKII